MIKLSFAEDPRLQELSVQARDFFHLLVETNPILLEGGRIPADCSQLRDQCYRHQPDIPATAVARFRHELREHFIVTYWTTSGGSSWLCCTPEFLNDHCNRPALPHPPNVQPIEPALSNNDASVGQVIHNSAGLSPPELKIIAAAAADPLDFCTRVREHFQGIDVIKEWNDYVQRCPGRATIEIFAERVLPKAQRRFGKISRNSPHKAGPSSEVAHEVGPGDISQPELFDAKAVRLSLREAVENKLKNLTHHQESGVKINA